MEITSNHHTTLTVDMVMATEETAKPRPPRRVDAWWTELQSQMRGLAERVLGQAWLGRAKPAPHEKLSEKVLADAIAMLGNGFLQSGRYDKAIEAFSSAIRHDPEFARAYYLLGITRSCRKEHQAAVDQFSSAISLDRHNAGYLFSRARSYEALRQWAAALADYSRAIELEPEHHGARRCLEELEGRMARTAER